MKIGLITYNQRHLKTEQIIQNITLLMPEVSFSMYALPFVERKKREVIFNHRPEMLSGAKTECIAKKYNIPFLKINSDVEIPTGLDFYLILGAGILSEECISGKKIVNCHPGIIPSSRGLDSFKWAILEKKPIGNSIHFIDEEIDAGEIISIIHTPIYSNDSIERLAERHYQMEIFIMCNFLFFLNNPLNKYLELKMGESKRRMGKKDEEMMLALFPDYLRLFSE